MRRARKMKRLASNRRRTMELIKCEDKGIMFDIRVEYYMAHDGVGNDKHDEEGNGDEEVERHGSQGVI
jgi:hypothetical protein